MERTDRNVDDFIGSLPDDARNDISAIDGVIAEVMSGLPRVLYTGVFWGGSDQEIIGYGDMDSPRSDGTTVEWFVVGLAKQKNYLSLYVNVVEDRKYLSETYGKKLGKVKVGKASISFGSADEIDLEELRSLVTRAREVWEAGT